MPDSLNQFFDEGGKKISKLISGPIDKAFGKELPISTGGAQKGKFAPDGESYPQGFTPPGWFDPKTGLWVDDRLSEIIPDMPGDHKSVNTSLSQDVPNVGIRNSPPGFTPVSYYRVPSPDNGLNRIKIVGSNIKNNFEPIGTPTKLDENITGFDKFDERMGNFRFGLSDTIPLIHQKNNRETFDGGFSDKTWEKAPVWFNDTDGTPAENEDPVYFGFEIVIDSINSPLLNGEVEKFIETMPNYEEISSRLEIIKSLKWEISKFFKLNNPLNEEGNIFKSSLDKRHYIKKIMGLDTLLELNGAKETKSFVKYREDKIMIEFYEDVQLSAGSFYSLYKLLYWSRLNGKNLIPENLLRFDCKVIVSELRNLTRVRRMIGSENFEVLKDNLSRYVYSLYECQFHFPRMPHPHDISMKDVPSSFEEWDIEISFKHSDMVFERFVFDSPKLGKYQRLFNGQINPQFVTKEYADEVRIVGGELQTGVSSSDLTVLGLASNEIEETVFDNLRFQSDDIPPDEIQNPTLENNVLDEVKKNTIRNIYNSSIVPITGDESSNENQNLLRTAGGRLLENLKKATLNEAQRQLNNQFRLLNNSIDRIRNSFGIGRMSAPTNVYENSLLGSRYFFDVQNSLRGFAGDVLTGIITRGN